MSSFVSNVRAGFDRGAVDQQIEQMLQEALSVTSIPNWIPACNVWEDDNGFYVQVALPGWEPNQIDLEVNNQLLSVKGTRDMASEDTGRYHLQEMGGTRFARLFKLPTFVDQEQASATHRHGVLTISFPKREEAKLRRIPIEGQ
jgi:HSP20 family protein